MGVENEEHDGLPWCAKEDLRSQKKAGTQMEESYKREWETEKRKKIAAMGSSRVSMEENWET